MLTVVPFSHCNTDVPEDVLIIHHLNDGVTNVCVADGVSGFHSPKCPNRIFERPNGSRTGGQVVGDIVQRAFLEATPGVSLRQILALANEGVARFAEQKGISLGQPDDLPAVDVAAAQITSDSVEIVQTGDCLAAWRLKLGGRVNATANQGKEFEAMKGPEFRRLQGAHGTAEAWNRIEPLFREARLKYTNVPREQGGYATINGQSAAVDCWFTQKFDREEIDLLLLFTDGLVVEEDTWDHQAMGEAIVKRYDTGKWHALLFDKGKHSFTEGTAIAVEL